MTDAPRAEGNHGSHDHDAFIDLVPMLRRVVGARVKDPHTVDDLVQETLARVMSARGRIEPDKLPHYAAVTARNLVASLAEKNERARLKSHLLVEDAPGESPAAELLRQEERSNVAVALANLPLGDQDLLMEHEVDGQDTLTIAAGRGSTPGAIAARLSRARASLRVEYLLVAEHLEPPTDRCRPVLRALSSGERRRQRELDVSGHLLACSTCAQVKTLMFERRDPPADADSVCITVSRDADVVEARQRGREVAARVGFSDVDQTLIATAISEITRNIVKFAARGEVVISPISSEGRRGVSVVARDVGPGVGDPTSAMKDGFSTYHGLGLGLPGAKRLMDRFDLVSAPDEGTTVTMEKWLP